MIPLQKRNPYRIQCNVGRPRKYALPVDAYRRALERYLNPTGMGRPPRKIVRIQNRPGLVCIECQKAKPLTSFWFSKSNKLYFESMCKACKRKYVRERNRKDLS